MSLAPIPATKVAPRDGRGEQSAAGAGGPDGADYGEGAALAAITEELLGLLGDPETSLGEALERICAAVAIRIGPCRTGASLRTAGGWELVSARGLRPQEWRALEKALSAFPPQVPGIRRLRAAPGEIWRGIAALERYEHCCEVSFADRSGRLRGAFHFFLPGGDPRPAMDRPGGVLSSLARLATALFEHHQLASHLCQVRCFDPATGLLNRAEFERQIAQATGAAGNSGHSFWLIALGFPRFHRVVESAGHKTGGQLLAAVGTRLRTIFKGPQPILARLEGAEFAALAPLAAQTVEAAAKEIVRRLSEPFRCGGRNYFLQPVAGLACFPGHAATAGDLLACAGAALHAAARRGAPGFRIYAPSLRQTLGGVDAETALRIGLDQGSFALHYQPVFDSGSGALSGFEALLRLRRPDQTLCPPALFLPAAEESGLIVPIGQWVIREACQSIRGWRRRLGAAPCVSVNVSAGQLAAPGFASTVAAELAAAELPPGALEIELTESLLMADLASARHVLEELKGLGVSIAIDDFGTGYSSLAYLHSLPVDKVKIDQSFVRSIGTRDSALPVIRAIVAMAEQLNLVVVAEGVETDEQLAAVRAARCHALQGFLLARPMPASEAERLAAAAVGAQAPACPR